MRKFRDSLDSMDWSIVALVLLLLLGLAIIQDMPHIVERLH